MLLRGLLLIPTVEVYLIATGRTLNVLLDPTAEAHDMEDVAARELFAVRHLIEANDAGRVRTGIGLLLALRCVPNKTHGRKARNLLN